IARAPQDLRALGAEHFARDHEVAVGFAHDEPLALGEVLDAEHSAMARLTPREGHVDHVGVRALDLVRVHGFAIFHHRIDNAVHHTVLPRGARCAPSLFFSLSRVVVLSSRSRRETGGGPSSSAQTAKDRSYFRTTVAAEN